MKVLKFSASWCVGCKTLQAIIDTLDTDVNIQSVDIEDEFEIARQYNIRAVPTLVMVDDTGTEMKRISGAMSKDKLQEWLDETIGK